MLDLIALTAVSFARLSGSEAELRIVVVSGAGSGQVDAAAAGGNDGGNAGLSIFNFAEIWESTRPC